MGNQGDGLGYRYIQQPLKQKTRNGIYYQGRPKKSTNNTSLPYPNFLDFVNEFNNAAYEGDISFKGGKKPTAFIRKLFEIAGLRKNAIVLDFFAGSGSTGQAVLEANIADRGNRQFILCTNNENNIMLRDCYPRIKKTIKGYENSNGKRVEGFGGSAKFYKTEFIGKHNALKVSDEDWIELSHNAGELISIAENTLDLVKQNKYYQLFENTLTKKKTAIYFREELDKFDDFVAEVLALQDETSVFIFSWGNETFSEEFSVNNKIKVKTIPKPILQIYQEINNTR